MAPELYDVLIIGGGPAGSSCARTLVSGGARVAVIDRAEFPRVKLCAGWLSPAFWDAAGLSPSEYPRGLWEWNTCHVHYRGKDHAVPCHGWFIRRYELDEFLLQRSGAELKLGISVKQIDRDADGIWSAGGVRGRILVGAGGTHCPVARMLAPNRPNRAVGVQELELPCDPASVARTRLGKNGEPELVLFDDVGGYGWNVPKYDWINIGCGTLDATLARGAWRTTHDHLRAAGHVPAEVEPQLEQMKGHSYYLFEPVHLDAAYKDGALIAGDSLGLAHPITAEGILPAVASGRRAAEAILAGDPASYPSRLRKDPVLADYRRVHASMAAVRKLLDRLPPLPGRARPSGAAKGSLDRSLGRAAIARGFAWMFSGARLPAPRLLDLVLGKGD